jgi:pyruvate kinase
VDLPALTEKDKSDLSFGAQRGVDFIAASFMRQADDVGEIRKLLTGRACK